MISWCQGAITAVCTCCCCLNQTHCPPPPAPHHATIPAFESLLVRHPDLEPSASGCSCLDLRTDVCSHLCCAAWVKHQITLTANVQHGCCIAAVLQWANTWRQRDSQGAATPAATAAGPSMMVCVVSLLLTISPYVIPLASNDSLLCSCSSQRARILAFAARCSRSRHAAAISVVATASQPLTICCGCINRLSDTADAVCSAANSASRLHRSLPRPTTIVLTVDSMMSVPGLPMLLV